MHPKEAQGFPKQPKGAKRASQRSQRGSNVKESQRRPQTHEEAKGTKYMYIYIYTYIQKLSINRQSGRCVIKQNLATGLIRVHSTQPHNVSLGLHF